MKETSRKEIAALQSKVAKVRRVIVSCVLCCVIVVNLSVGVN